MNLKLVTSRNRYPRRAGQREGRQMPIRMMVVDGHTLTRYGLSRLVAQHADLELVAECGSATRARQVITAARPDVVTIDVTLPDGNGLQLARELRDRDDRL